MTGRTWGALALGTGVGAALAYGAVVLWPIGRLIKENHAGRLVVAGLGLALVPAGVAAHLALRPPGPLAETEVAAIASLAGLLAAGVLDDLVATGPRGLAGHLAALARGRPTTGILKLVAGTAAGVWLALVAGGGAPRVAATILLVATSVNLGNALDVAPGRSIKSVGVLLAATLPALWGTTEGVLVAAILGASLGVLAMDLRERGMLGDAGANPLGYTAGFALAIALPTWGVIVAAGTAILMQVAAETVTISHVIRESPPLAWLDRLGRR